MKKQNGVYVQGQHRGGDYSLLKSESTTEHLSNIDNSTWADDYDYPVSKRGSRFSKAKPYIIHGVCFLIYSLIFFSKYTFTGSTKGSTTDWEQGICMR